MVASIRVEATKTRIIWVGNPTMNISKVKTWKRGQGWNWRENACGPTHLYLSCVAIFFYFYIASWSIYPLQSLKFAPPVALIYRRQIFFLAIHWREESLSNTTASSRPLPSFDHRLYLLCWDLFLPKAIPSLGRHVHPISVVLSSLKVISLSSFFFW